MKLKFWTPYFFFMIPTITITCFTWPTHVWADYPAEELTSILGFSVMMFFTTLTYYLGLRAVLKEKADPLT